MIEKIRVAVIYKSDNVFQSGHHFDNCYYNFFMNALMRNKRLDVKNFPTESEFDASILRNQFDVILLWSNNDWGMPNEIKGIQELDIPVIARSGDPGNAKKSIKNHKRWKINYYFGFHHEQFFHELYPSNFKYKTIFFGLEPSLYENLKPFNERIKNRISVSGATGNKKFLARIINNVRDPKWNAYRCYFLRTECTKLSYIDYTSTLTHEYVGDMYPKLLEKYAASVAASTHSPVIKFWEIPAAGCLTFMEVTDKNRGEYLGFEDGKSAVFIDEDNYKLRLKQYLSEPDNPKWERIAKAGRIHSLENFNNDKAVCHLIDLMDEILSDF